MSETPIFGTENKGEAKKDKTDPKTGKKVL